MYISYYIIFNKKKILFWLGVVGNHLKGSRRKTKLNFSFILSTLNFFSDFLVEYITGNNKTIDIKGEKERQRDR